jgi:hypothetical protein
MPYASKRKRGRTAGISAGKTTRNGKLNGNEEGNGKNILKVNT